MRFLFQGVMERVCMSRKRVHVDFLPPNQFEAARSNCGYALSALQLEDFVTATSILAKTLNILHGTTLDESFSDCLEKASRDRTPGEHDISRANFHCQQAQKHLDQSDATGAILNMEKSVMLLMNSPK